MSIRVSLNSPLQPDPGTPEEPVQIVGRAHLRPFIVRLGVLGERATERSNYFVIIPMTAGNLGSSAMHPMFKCGPNARPQEAITYEFGTGLDGGYVFVRMLGDNEFVGFSGE